MLAPKARKGDRIEFSAEVDLYLAVSACPVDQSALNGFTCRGLELRLLSRAR